MSHYRWSNPIDWLIWKVKSMDENELRAEIINLAQELDPDTVQDLYQIEMEQDGYFEKL